MRLRLFRNATQRLHLGSLDHGEVSRDDLRAQARAAGIPETRLLIPEDGETLEL